MEVNGNGGFYPSGSESAEDLSEYTDADESMSAPTEILAEFLSALMLKDYPAALKYCKIILQYEPNHSTAKEFYPLLIQKIEFDVRNVDRNGNKSRTSSSDSAMSQSSGDSSSDEASTDSSSSGGRLDRNSDATSASYSSLEDEEAEDSHHRPFSSSSPASYSPVLDNADVAQDDFTAANITTNSAASSSSAAAAAAAFYNNGNNYSDSESPTEPITQQLAARIISLKL